MAKYIIEGGVPLRGTVKIPGAKNSGFKLMIASLLSDELSTISNIPFIRDVVSVKRIIQALGAKVELSEDTIQIKGPISEYIVPEELGTKSRASFMYLPILLHRFKKAVVHLPVGDKIGERPINWFLDALSSMKVRVTSKEEMIEVHAPTGLSGTNYTFPKNSHTGTEALILAAVLANGTTIINNAAMEPEVDDLIAFLNKMGSNISRTKQRQIQIKGVHSLKGTTFKVMPDRNEVVTFGCLALATAGEIKVENVNPDHLKKFISKVRESGGNADIISNSINFSIKKNLTATNIVTEAYPGFMSDWQSLWTALMTGATGTSIIHETIFENRFTYTDFLVKMGAEIELFSPSVSNPEKFYNFGWNEHLAKLPHAAKVYGPRKLSGKNTEVNDIRSGATLVMAALMAQGTSEISNIEHIERGYEDLEGRLERLGAKIRKVED